MRALTSVAGVGLLVALAGWGWLVWTGLLPAADGLLPFDLRVLGYDLAATNGYLSALGPDGDDVIAGPLAMWGTALPVALTLFLASLALSRQSGKLGWLAVVMALSYGTADLLENAAVRRLVAAGSPAETLTVSGASLLTRIKFGFLALASVMTLLARFTGRRRR